MADVEAGEAVTTNSLFRIASLSKPITAVAILKLVDVGEIELDSKVVEVLGLQPEQYAGDPRIEQITIRQLLHHYGGWNRDRSGDPMFMARKIAKSRNVEMPPSRAQIRDWMFARELDSDPGTEYAYSNFGYMLLGQVIEKVSGLKYEQYLQQHIFHPLDLKQFQLGRTSLKHRAENEVRYYANGKKRQSLIPVDHGEKVAPPYGTFVLETMDAHGGWLATASDLALFVVAVDLVGPNLLSPESVQAMTARFPGPNNKKPQPVYYGCGWLVRELKNGGKNIWHNGALPGTSTLLVARHDGYTWAVLFNARRTADGANLSGAIDSLMHRAVNQTQYWPMPEK